MSHWGCCPLALLWLLWFRSGQCENAVECSHDLEYIVHMHLDVIISLGAQLFNINIINNWSQFVNFSLDSSLRYFRSLFQRSSVRLFVIWSFILKSFLICNMYICGSHLIIFLICIMYIYIYICTLQSIFLIYQISLKRLSKLYIHNLSQYAQLSCLQNCLQNCIHLSLLF